MWVQKIEIWDTSAKLLGQKTQFNISEYLFLNYVCVSI